jgi:cytochrome c-type biogenesis protein CcmH/NrfG
MSDVPLNEAVAQLRAHVHSGRHAEALALGRHILHYFPKHVETYVLLGQVSLDVNDLSSANDLFRRVLSSDPENVMALAGMALISGHKTSLKTRSGTSSAALKFNPPMTSSNAN